MAQFVTFKTYCYIHCKCIRLYEHQQETKVPFLAIFGTFSRKSSEIDLTDDKTSILFTYTCNISPLHIRNDFL